MDFANTAENFLYLLNLVMSAVTRVILLPGKVLRKILIEPVVCVTKFLMVTTGRGMRQVFMRILVNLNVINVIEGLLI